MAEDAAASTSAPLWLRDRKTGRPLRVLVTRPADAAHETAALIDKAGGEALICPCLWPAPATDELAMLRALSETPGHDAVAFTSRYAVGALAAALARLTPTRSLAQALAGCCVAAVGRYTAAALAELGRPADLVSDGEGGDSATSSAEGLASLLIARLAAAGPAQVLFLRAAEARPTLPAALRRAGLRVTEVEAYRMRSATAAELAPLALALQHRQVDLAPFGSPRSVTIALSVLGPDAASLFAPVRVGAIGETTALALRQAGLHIDVVARRPSFSELLSELASLPR